MFAGLPEGPHLQETVHAYTGCHLAQQQSVRRLGTCSGFRVSPSETRTQSLTTVSVWLRETVINCPVSAPTVKRGPSAYATWLDEWQWQLELVEISALPWSSCSWRAVSLYVQYAIPQITACTSQPDSTSFRDSYGQINAQNFCAGILKCF